MSAAEVPIVDRADAGSDGRRAESLVSGAALQSAIFHSANFSCIATDAAGVIQIFNVGAERMLGYAAAEVVNRITPAHISDGEELNERARALSAEAGEPITPGFEALVFKAARGIEDIYELTYCRKDGSRFPAVVSVTALRDVQGGIIGYLLIGTDNTARKQVEEERARLEQALRHKNAELEAASHAKIEFLANMSHELRTPLNAIIGFSEVLRDGLVGELTPRQRGLVGDIFGSGRHLLSLINDILDLSKIEAGEMTLDLEVVPVAALLANSLSIVREKATSRRVQLHLDVGDERGSVRADVRKVKQIVYNLLSNAVKFTPEGGRVTLQARRVPPDEAGRLTGPWSGRCFPPADHDAEQYLEISVTDSGIGMSPEGLERLFVPFGQVDDAPARALEGTGLGLAMVKLFTELHGGGVAVESAPGEGSCFRVWLPLRSAADGAVVSASGQSPNAVEVATGARLALVVEDDLKSADLIRVHLEAEGFEVLHATSAEAALTVAALQPLSLITLDIRLPGMDGWEFLERIKQVPALRAIPVVIISIVADRGKGFALGASAVLMKPIARQELYDTLVDLGLFPLQDGRTLRVLVVDDDPLAVALIASRILGFASSVLRAYGGAEAIEMARQTLPDLILLDLLMPEVNGFDVVTALRARPETARIPIVVVTAKQVTADDRKRLNGYVMAIMEKGDFDGERFTNEVRLAMSRHATVT